MNLKIIPFSKEHLSHYKPGEIDKIGLDWKQLEDNCGNMRVSCIIDGRVAGFGGLVVNGGEATVSVFLSDELRNKPIFITREMLRWIDTLKASGIKRLKASACVSTSKKWLEFLGFEPTGETKRINGVTADVYSMELA